MLVKPALEPSMMYMISADGHDGAEHYKQEDSREGSGAERAHVWG